MNRTKFTMTSFLLIFGIFSLIWFFITVSVVDLSDRSAVEEAYPLESTGLTVRYSSLRKDGLYRGDDLLLAGTFGYDWGAHVEGSDLYCNEYHNTSFGFLLCDLVRIDLNTFEKEVLSRNAILRGVCPTGELVFCKGFVSPNWEPATNELRQVLRFADTDIPQSAQGAVVCYYDTAQKQIVLSLSDDDALTDEREAYYLAHGPKEVRQ